MTLRVAFVFLALSFSAAAADRAGPQQLAWMAGCWAFERDGTRYEEIWLPPTANGTLGMARAVKDGKTLYHEFTRLDPDPDAGVRYVASPSRQKETPFPLVKLDGTRAAFENAAHDYPTRIIYAYTAPDRLDARIEGTVDGKEQSGDYPFRRVPCPGALPEPASQ